MLLLWGYSVFKFRYLPFHRLRIRNKVYFLAFFVHQFPQWLAEPFLYFVTGRDSSIQNFPLFVFHKFCFDLTNLWHDSRDLQRDGGLPILSTPLIGQNFWWLSTMERDTKIFPLSAFTNLLAPRETLFFQALLYL